MPEKDTEVFSNPLPPQHEVSYSDEADSHQPLSNSDFRKLMMTPRVPSSAKPALAQGKETAKDAPKPSQEDAATRRKKKKMEYAKLKQEREEREKALSQKYRDRAQERREGHNKDYDDTEFVSTTADYRAVAPDAKAQGDTYREHRKQVIQESKYLGGDMEHTHLVKGLDFALLEKVRAEITTKEQIEEDGMEEALEDKKEEKEDPEVKMEFRSRMGRNVYRMVFKNKLPERHELFLPKRMAYVVHLEDEDEESDIPTTLIRSKADCPNVEQTTTLTTNDIVINKLTQILSYLRQGRRDRKKKLKDKKIAKEEKKLTGNEDGIYGDLGDYLPSFSKSKKDEKEREKRERRDKERTDRDTNRRDRDRDREKGRPDRYGDRDRQKDRRDRDGREGDREKKRSYFEKPVDEDEEVKARSGQPSASDLVQSINDKFTSQAPTGWNDEYEEKKEKKKQQDTFLHKIKDSGYYECYPGFAEADDAIVESDEEADYTKMDPGNKKGPLSRWDFETQDDYSSYMSNKEALPKAAFQYGVKMADGRKTRRAGPKDEKKELDREWQKIQNIMQKRKQMGTEGGPDNKYAKY